MLRYGPCYDDLGWSPDPEHPGWAGDVDPLHAGTDPLLHI